VSPSYLLLSARNARFHQPSSRADGRRLPSPDNGLPYPSQAALLINTNPVYEGATRPGSSNFFVDTASSA
jgi:hypothetical protein